MAMLPMPGPPKPVTSELVQCGIENEALSRFMACLLRHQGPKENLPMDDHGFAYVADVLAVMKSSRSDLGCVTEKDLKELVQFSLHHDGKPRFQLSECRRFIRASKHHTIQGVCVRKGQQPCSGWETYGTSSESEVQTAGTSSEVPEVTVGSSGQVPTPATTSATTPVPELCPIPGQAEINLARALEAERREAAAVLRAEWAEGQCRFLELQLAEAEQKLNQIKNVLQQ